MSACLQMDVSVDAYHVHTYVCSVTRIRMSRPEVTDTHAANSWSAIGKIMFCLHGYKPSHIYIRTCELRITGETLATCILSYVLVHTSWC